jgi:hypothetical protein
VVTAVRYAHVLQRLLLSACAVVGLLAGLELAARVVYANLPAFRIPLAEQLRRSERSGLAEGAQDFSLRGLVRPSPYPDVVYELKPGLRGRFRGQVVEVNSLGFRGAEIAAEKPAGAFRIAGLGDSVMFGWGVGQDEYYLKVLEDRLHTRHPGRRFETINSAIPGYNTAMEVAVFEHRVLPLQPDAVVIQFINNDFGAPIFMQRPRNVWSLRHSFLRDWLRPEGDMVDAKEADPEDFGEPGEYERIVDQYRYMVGADGYRRAMGRLAALTKPRGIPVVVLRGTFTKDQGQVLDEVVAAHGFHVLDIGPVTTATMEKLGLPTDTESVRDRIWIGKGDHHPNAFGHTIYADGLLETFSRLGIPGPPSGQPLAQD